jgi:hypothetical protein
LKITIYSEFSHEKSVDFPVRYVKLPEGKSPPKSLFETVATRGKIGTSATTPGKLLHESSARPLSAGSAHGRMVSNHQVGMLS